VPPHPITNPDTGGVIPDTTPKILASLDAGGTLTGGSEITPVPEDDYMMVEFDDLETAAGILGGGNVEALPERKKRLVPKEYAKGLYLVVRVHGHSMDDGTKRSITEGEELLIKQYFGDIGNAPIRNKLFVIVTNEGSVVKQIVDKTANAIICHSFNPSWEDYSIKIDEILQIFTVEKKVKSNIIF
jgi:phage repressor protein C with HTH and peptisase S24 domain